MSPLYNITPFTLLDFPDCTACILWFAGCNMRCQYCYNPEIVLGKGNFGYDRALNFLKKRRGLLDGVVLSGGECTLHKGLEDFAADVKLMGYRLKIDTNGSRPKVLKRLVDQSLVDYVALDLKAMPKHFKTITNSNLFKEFEQSLELLLHAGIGFEVRTTVHSSLIDREHLEQMGQYLQDAGYRGNFYVQHFVNGSQTLRPLPYSGKIDIARLNLPGVNLIFRG
ncbi:MAG TPA: anaerobic ribonucleoside-triphosphate reductase activating protein [Flavobacterium sp.]|nr:anaerobic ribonucleoside-triphosphate reductase activating protein [Flavobacterium sp.]